MRNIQPHKDAMILDTFGRKEMLTQDVVKALTHYDPETGSMVWTQQVSRSVKIGDEVGHIDKTKDSNLLYRRTEIFNKQYRVHRLIWLYMTGEWPNHVDHEDGNGLNNKWNNLRTATRSMNQRNRKLNKNSTTGILGVSWITSRNHYKVSINVDGKKKTLGYTKDFFEACCMRKSAENKYGYHANHGRAA